jgi:hypothetical protein
MVEVAATIRDHLTKLEDNIAAHNSRIVHDAVLRIPIPRDGRDGKDGINGRDGKDGLDGRDGRNGENGKDGTDGTNGVDGLAGKDGIDGRDGEDGVNGIDGRYGIDGKDGERGKDGADGADGLHGKDGADGAPGRDGINGKDGADGKDGRDGLDGAVGRNGIDGKDGAPGLVTCALDPKVGDFIGRGQLVRLTNAIWQCTREGTWPDQCQLEPVVEGVIGVDQRVEDNGRTIITAFKFATGKTSEFTQRAPALVYRQVWNRTNDYEQGDVVTKEGNLWIAVRDKPEMPGVPDSGWQLCVKGADIKRNGNHGN